MGGVRRLWTFSGDDFELFLFCGVFVICVFNEGLSGRMAGFNPVAPRHILMNAHE